MNLDHVLGSGKSKATVVNWRGLELIWIVPPCAETIHFAMLKPRPQPSTARLRLASARKNGSNTRDRCADDIPGPVFEMINSAHFCARASEKVTSPFGALYLTALSTRFNNVCRKR